MSKKKFLVLGLCFGMAAGMLSAGGGSQTTGTSADSGGRMSLTTIGPQLAPLEPNAKMIKYWNDKFNVDIQVWDVDSAGYNEILSLKLMAGEIPDYFHIGGPADLKRYYEQDLLAEIPEDLIKKSMPLLYADFNEIYPNFLNLRKINGKIYGIPVIMEKSYRGSIVYRGDWIEAVGKQRGWTPTTMGEFEELMYAFTNNDPDKNGKKDTYGLSNTAIYIVYGAYGYIPYQWNDKNGSLVYTSIQPEMKEALQVLNKWYKDGVIDPEFITGENKGGYWALSHAFIEGRIGVSSQGAYYHWIPEDGAANQNYKEMKAINPAGAASITFGEPITGPGGKKGLNRGQPVSASSLVFGKHLEKEPAKMAKVLEMQDYFNKDKETYLTARMGIQGEDWDYVNGTPAYHRDVNYASAIGAHQVMVRVIGSNDTLWRTPSWGEFLTANNYFSNGYMNELLVTLPSASVYLTELNKIEDETYLSIITGERPVSYFDTFVSQWKAAGGDILTKEANDWYNTVK